MHTEEIAGKTFETWTPQEVHAGLAAGEVVLIDVRTPAEYSFECIAGAFLAPLAQIGHTTLPEEGGKRIVLHCGSGMRSRKAAEALLAAGAPRLAHMEGGFAAWKTAGLPYLATDPATGGPRSVPQAG